MEALLYPAFAAAISMAIIPLMIRLAPRLGMINLPDPRKVHSHPIPRVGGWGIILGALGPIIVFMPFDAALGCYVFGSVVLLGFGSRDDYKDIGHYAKFGGQLLAVAPVVIYAGVRVDEIPLLASGPLDPTFSIVFTIFAMVGCINAINHSDGLDGLAGGEALLSLIVLALLGFDSDVLLVTWVSLAVIGGLLGFLRFNTHPARVFMGDSGSQFLGFTLAFLVVHLIGEAPTLSSALPALILGLPIIDIIAVLAQRIHGGMNWFKATRNHIHHRLLDLNFDHYESVVMIYGVQAFFVVCAVLLKLAHDGVIIALYLGTAAAIFTLLVVAERRGWHIARPRRMSRTARLISRMSRSRILHDGPVAVVAVAVPAYVLGSCALIEEVPQDYGLSALALFALLLFEIVRGRAAAFVGRISIYATVLFVIFLTIDLAEDGSPRVELLELVYFVLLAAAIALGVRFSSEVRFATTPLDYLVIFVVLVITVFPINDVSSSFLSTILIQGLVILYGCELLLSRMVRKWSPLGVASLAALAIIGVRGVAAI